MPVALTSPRGLRLLIDELPHTHSISIGYFVGVGACHEPAHISGVSHVIEHMCFKGTQSLPNALLISDEIEGVGGILNASTAYESTVYWAKVANIHFDRAVRVLTDMLRYPLFDARELEKERRVIIEELRSSQDTPSDWVHTVLQESMWGDQPLGRDIAGSLASLMALQLADMTQFWQQHYTPTNVVISVAGNVSQNQVVSALETAFALSMVESFQPAVPMTYKKHYVDLESAPTLVQPPLPGPQVTLLAKETEQSNFCLGFPALSYRDPDRRALQVLDTIVGGSMTSRLFQTLREDLGLAYNIGSYGSELADAGMWVVYGGVEPEALIESVDVVLAILRDLIAEGVTEEEIRRVKEQVKGGVLLSLEDTWSVASRNGAHQLRYNEVIPIERVVAEVEAITCADVQRVAQRVLRQQTMHLAVIGPHDDADAAHLRGMVETAFA